MESIGRNAPAKARKVRPAGTGRTLECQLGSDNQLNITAGYQHQWLKTRHRVPAIQADLVAYLAWGAVRHG